MLLTFHLWLRKWLAGVPGTLLAIHPVYLCLLKWEEICH